jgi:transaldolase
MSTASGTTLAQLRTMTVVVADTGELQQIEKYRPQDATTNPSLITAAAGKAEYQDVIERALRWASGKASGDGRVRAAVDRLAVEFGLRILQLIPGRVSTEVDARKSFDTQATVDQARAIIAQYAEAGVPRERVLIKIASTWEGIKAAELLEREGIHCNLTLLFGLHQAAACAEAEATLISPFVGRIVDWYRKSTGRDSYPPVEDPGVVSVTTIYNYFKRYDYRTEVMGASFRNAGEITELAGCDLLTISPALLGELEASTAPLSRKLDPARARSMAIDKLTLDEAAFRTRHAADEMASDKLAEGIQGFTDALVALEKLIAARYAA